MSKGVEHDSLLPRADSKANVVQKGVVVIYIEHITRVHYAEEEEEGSTNADNIRMKVRDGKNL